MGPQEDYIETVVTCEGDFHDPQLPRRLECFRQQLKDLLLADPHKPLILKKVEPWNSVRVTFNIPREAALRLKQLAEQGSATLRRLGVLAVQIDGDQLVSLTLAAPNNQHAELIIRTHDASAQATTAGPSQASASVGTATFDTGRPGSSDEVGSPGPSSMEVTRKNIEEYLRQGSIFNSILAPSSSAVAGSGSELNGPGSDVFKTPSGDSGPFRPNSVGSDLLAGSSGLANFQQRSQFTSSGSLGSGVGTGAYSSAFSASTPGPSGRGSRLAVPGQQGLATALPQTAAVGFNMQGLPPPPPYPHGSAPGVVNNVGPKGKKVTASSPLLVNLLKTEPLAGGGGGGGGGVNSKMADSTDPPKRKRRRVKKKDKLAAASTLEEGEQSTHSSALLPTNPAGPFSSVLNDVRPSPEDIPVTSPHLTAGSLSVAAPVVDRGVGEDRLVKSPPSASAALAAMAESQRMNDGDSSAGDTIINPYTGQLEPRDLLTDLSPGKKDPHKARKSPSISESLGIGGIARGFTSTSNVVPAVAAVLDSVLERAAAMNPLRLDSALQSVPSGSVGRNERHTAPVLSSSREVSERHPTVNPISGSQAPPRAHGLANDSVIGRLQDLVSQSGPVATSATPIYAQHPSIATQSTSRTPALMMSDSMANGPRQTPPSSVAPSSPAALIGGQLTVNGPIPSRTSPKTVSAGSSTLGQETSSPQRTVAVPAMFTGTSSAMPSHVQPSVGPTPHQPHPVHNVHNVGGSDGRVGTAALHEQHSAVTQSESTLHRPVPAMDKGPVSVREVTNSASPPIPTTSTSITSNDASSLLNSSSTRLSPSLTAATHQASADPASINTASPVGSKALSEGDDNSNHSGIGPDGMADGTTATGTLLDASSTKTYNHDSGLGSASERSDDTPSEPGDGEYHTSTVTAEPTNTEGSNAGKPASSVVSKGPVNCKTEAPGSMEPNTITVGYVHVNEHTAHIYSKEIKEQPLLKDIQLPAHQDTSSLASGDKMLSEDTLHDVTQLVKSSAMTSVTGKESSAALPLSHVVTTPSASMAAVPHHLAKSKGIANCQVTAVHQNGPVRSYSPDQPTAHTAPRAPSKAGSPGQLPDHELKAAPLSHSHAVSHQNSTTVNSLVEGVGHNTTSAASYPGVSSSLAVATLVTRATAACVTATSVTKHSHSDAVLHSSAPMSATAEPQNKTVHVSDVSSVVAPTADKAPLTNAVKQRVARSSASSVTAISADAAKSSGLDPGSMPPELIAVSARDSSELDILEASQHLYHSHEGTSNDAPHSPVFENDELVLAGERGLPGFLDAEVRHGATNGGGVGGVSTDARAGSNITSIYSKRSSPVNVNMLNHIYAPGLPLPRRLTESVQRLVKPLPATENPLPQPRTCKSPGASSSRHSSNGASSPGRASQGGARSPGVSTAASVSRMLSYDKTVASQAGFVNSSTAAMSVGYLPSSHSSHTMQEACSSVSVNCCTSATLSSTAHAMSNAQPAFHMVTASNTTSSSFPVSAPLHGASASVYNQPVSSFVSASCYSPVVPQQGVQTTAGAATHLPTPSPAAVTSQLQTAAHHSIAASSSPLVTSAPSLPVTVPPRLQHPPRSHSMQGVQNLHSTNSTASSVHVASSPASSQVPHSSAVGSISSSVSSSLAVTAGHEVMSGAGHSLPQVLRLPGQAVSRSSPGHPVTLCNNLPSRYTTASGLPPHVTVSSAPLSLASLSSQSAPVICAASQVRTPSSPLRVTAAGSNSVTSSSNSAAVSCPVSDLTTRTHISAVQVSASTITTTNTTAVLTSTTPASAVKPHVAPRPLASTIPVTVTHQKVPSVSKESSSGAVLEHVAGATSSTKTSESVHVQVTTSSSVVSEGAQLAAKGTIGVCVTGSSGREMGEKGMKEQTVEVETSVSRTRSGKPSTEHTQKENLEGTIPTSVAAESAKLDQQPSLRAVSGNAGSATKADDKTVKTSDSAASSAQGSALVVSSEQHVPVTSAERTAGSANQAVCRNSDSGGAPGNGPEAEVSSEGMHSLLPSSSEKPPQLQPAPPPLIPTVVPSATPPPPPLTPVPQELTKREHPPQAASSQPADPSPADHVHTDKAPVPPVSTTAPVASASHPEVPQPCATVSTSQASTEPAATVVENSSSQPSVTEEVSTVDEKHEAVSEDAKSTGKTQIPSTEGTNSDASAAPKPAANPPTSHGMPELSSEDTGRSRRITRKRKSTQSESDSSEPPQKLSNSDGGSGGGNSRDKSSDREGGKSGTGASNSDQPPKLQREGKRSNATDEAEKDKDKSSSKDAGHHHERNIIEATPEEIAKKLAAASGKRRTYYVYVPEKSLSQSYFDTPVLQGRTRSQSSHTTTKDGSTPTPPTSAAATSATASTSGSQSAPASGQSASQAATGQKDEGTEGNTTGSKRSTRQRNKDTSDSSSSKRKRGKEHR